MPTLELNKKNTLLAAEFLFLCIIIPGILIYGRLAPYMFYFLWAAAIYGLFIIRRYHFDSIKEIWNSSAVSWLSLKPILIRFIICTIGMVLFLMWYAPERLFYIQNNAPQIIPFLLALYPIFSALPQEIVFCSFFFARYAPFFGTGKGMIIASAIIFAYAHVLYINPVAPILGLVAGAIFAETYWRHKSLAMVTIEHGLYGNAMFLVGLGYYFWHGSVGASG